MSAYVEPYVQQFKGTIGFGNKKVTEAYEYGSREITRVVNNFTTEAQKVAENNNVNSPLPTDLQNETERAVKILSQFVDLGDGSLKNVIPKDVIHKAKGLAIFAVAKAGLFWSVRAGSGIVIAKNSRGWSAPSCIKIAGIGFGTQFGADFTNFVIVLNTDEAVNAFSRGDNITLGGNLSVSAGPIGMGTEVSSSIYERSAMYSYTNSKGFFAGVSLEGTVIMERKGDNEHFYKKDVSAKDILSGEVNSKALNNNRLYDVIKRIEGTD
jgi:lipid-binding SYLF domain-containing protein